MINIKVQKFLEELFASNRFNRLPDQYGGIRIFSTPLIGVAKGDDSIFQKFKEIVGPNHLTPIEMWAASGLPNASGLESQLRIVSIIFPYVSKIREESKNARKMPAEVYCVGRNYANEFMSDVLKQTVKFFRDEGFLATTGILNDAFNIIFKDKIYSTWSERHIAFAAGLGTFSLHEGLITELGCNIRLASVITDASLDITSRVSDDPYANCLFYAKGSCKKCIDKCPIGAISEEGHDKIKCLRYEQKVARKINNRLGSILKPHYRRLNGRLQKQIPPVGCAFCQFGVPCMDKNPMATEQKKSQISE